MTQDSLNVLGGSGAAVHAKINLALQALGSNNSGATEPATRYPTMNWSDMTLALKKHRNTADTAWVTEGPIDEPYFGINPQMFTKLDPMSVAFTKTGSGTISIKAGSAAMCFGVKLAWATDTAVTMPALTAGTDYAVYICTDGTIRADASFTAPTGYSTANSRMIGGFHYGLIAPGTVASIANGFNITASASMAGTTTNGSAVVTGITSTAALMKGMNASGTGIPASTYIVSVDSGTQVTLSNAATAAGSPTLTFTNTGMVWVQADVDKLAGINQYSLWDLHWRAKSSDLRAQKGFAYSPEAGLWGACYIASSDTDTNGLSKAGSNIASGTVLPKIPAVFGGNGTATYGALDWWIANELARAYGCRLPTEAEFNILAFGTGENSTIDATASTYPTTQHNTGYTSKYGIEQATGHHWIWGNDSNFSSEVASPTYTWKDVNGNTGAAGAGRGQINTAGSNGLSRATFGGARVSSVDSGSRASSWGTPWGSGWFIGLRPVCEHMISA